MNMPGMAVSKHMLLIDAEQRQISCHFEVPENNLIQAQASF
jgi:hypothetical protein